MCVCARVKCVDVSKDLCVLACVRMSVRVENLFAFYLKHAPFGEVKPHLLTTNHQENPAQKTAGYPHPRVVYPCPR